MAKRLLQIGIIQLVVVILAYLVTGMLSNYYYKQMSAQVREARNAGYNSKIEATLYEMQPYTYEGQEYILINYGNTDLFGGSYSDYALISPDTNIDKKIKIDERFCLMYEDQERVELDVSEGKQPGEILDAYNMVHVNEVSDELLLIILICLPFSGMIFVALAIAALIVHIVKKRKEVDS